MIPTRFEAYREMFPALEEATDWQLLRKWSLSEVYRFTTKLGETRIIKWGGSEMAGEAAIYSSLLVPLEVRSVIIYDSFVNEQGGIFIMEDAGPHDLEQAPEAVHYIEAARELARLRATATENLSHNKLSQPTLDKYTTTAEDFLRQLDELQCASTDSKPTYTDPEQTITNPKHTSTKSYIDIIQKAFALFPEKLKKLYQEVPLTLVHHDYHGKNLLIQGNRTLAIDWSNAYLSPHLGDLYGLISEANVVSNVSTSEMLDAYLAEISNGIIDMEQLVLQVKIGGICWFVRTLRWLVYGGTDTIVGSIDWLPDIFDELNTLLDQLDKSDLYV